MKRSLNRLIGAFFVLRDPAELASLSGHNRLDPGFVLAITSCSPTMAFMERELIEPALPPELMGEINMEAMPREKMHGFKGQFQIVCIAICVIVFLILLSTLGNTVITWSVFVVGVVLLASEILTRSMPSMIRQRSFANCIRSDGSWSRGRASVERLSFARFKLNLVFILSMSILPSLLGIWLFNKEVMPLGIGFDVVTSIGSDPDNWRDSVQDEESRFARWQKSSTIAEKMGSEEHKQAIWNSWPAFLIGGVAWFVAVFFFVANYYIYCVGKLKQSVFGRAKDYRIKSLERQPFHLPHRRSRDANIAEPAK